MIDFITTILAFAVAIGVLVVIHEFGHYWVARRCGVKVLRFSVGFGKRLFSWRHGPDQTEFAVCALPLGGYVRMLDERDETQQVPANEAHRAFNRQSVGKRFLIVLAGPVANFLLAILLYTSLNLAGVLEPAAKLAPPPAGTIAASAGLGGGETVVGIRNRDGSITPVRSWDDLRWRLLAPIIADGSITLVAAGQQARRDYRLNLAGSRIGADDDFMRQLGLQPAGQIFVSAVIPNDAGAQGGLLAGDRVTEIDGLPLYSAAALVSAVHADAGRAIQLTVLRNGKTQILTVTPRAQHDSKGNLEGKIGVVLVNRMHTVEVRYGPLQAIERGAQHTWDVTRFSFQMLGKMIVGQASLKNLSGPVTIADYAGQSARLGLSYFIAFLALVSISLGVLNLLPIPVLDGGYLLYYAVEAITGRAVPEQWQGVLQRIGLICIVLLSAVALSNDLSKLLHF